MRQETRPGGAQARLRRAGGVLVVLAAVVLGGPPVLRPDSSAPASTRPLASFLQLPRRGVPGGTTDATPTPAPAADQPVQDMFAGEVERTGPLQPCPGRRPETGGLPGTGPAQCQDLEVQLTDGAFVGRMLTMDQAVVPPGAPPGRGLQPGDRVQIEWEHTPGAPDAYYVVDFIRTDALAILLLLFAAVAIALGRLRGLTSLLGLAVSFGVIIYVILPGLLAGEDPLWLSLAGAGVIMIVTLYLSHGLNWKSTAAIGGTAISLVLTGLLAIWALDLAHLSGYSSEEAALLQGLPTGPVNVRGLLLGGIVIGALGVLNDITIGQASAVFELHSVDPRLTGGQLFRHVTNIGRDHIAATVNTLVLAYAGTSLPLLILFAAGGAPWTQVVNQEIVADEVVRTLVGSIGLITAVPLTTALASLLVIWRAGQGAPRMPEAPAESGPAGAPV